MRTAQPSRRHAWGRRDGRGVPSVVRLGQIREPSGVAEALEVEGELGVHDGDVERGAAERGGDEGVAFEEEEVGAGGEDQRGVDGAREGVDRDGGKGGCGRGAGGGGEEAAAV